MPGVMAAIALFAMMFAAQFTSSDTDGSGKSEADRPAAARVAAAGSPETKE